MTTERASTGSSMFGFTIRDAATEGQNRLHLRKLLQRYANEQWSRLIWPKGKWLSLNCEGVSEGPTPPVGAVVPRTKILRHGHDQNMPATCVSVRFLVAHRRGRSSGASRRRPTIPSSLVA